MQNKKEAIEAEELKKQKVDKKEDFNNKVVRIFDGALEDGEKVVKAFKPSKFGFYLYNLIKPFAVYCVFILLFIFLYLYPSEDLTKTDLLTVLYIITGLTILVEVAIVLITKKHLKNSCYIITNKRIIISYGFFETLFKFVKFEDIKDVQLKFSILDKFLGKRFGSIYFYPVDKKFNLICFYLTEKPLESYLDIEEVLEKD